MDAVILDVGGVLLIPDAEVVSAALAPFGLHVSAELAERAHYTAIAALDAARDDAGQEFNAYRDTYACVVGIGPAAHAGALDQMNALWHTSTLDLWRQPVRGSLEGLRRLAERDLKLAIVSNADGTIEEQLRRREICQVGEGLGVPVLAIIDSHVVQVAKPAAEIFRRALDPIGVSPERALYVGDTVRYDVTGARAAGLHPVHFDPFDLCPGREDHPHIRTLAGVEALL